MSAQNSQHDTAAPRAGDAQSTIANTSSTTLPSGASAEDTLLCKWKQCGERADSAESLFEHLCERHIGRKSTNNLNLVCGWEGCNTSTVKRDHITSHVRVHVPLKPHKCGFCGKAFKRPQDLKKHVKTHADDSVLVSPPGHPSNPNSGYRHPPPKMIADLSNFAATATGYYDHQSHMHHSGPPAGYANPHHHAPTAYYNPQQPSNYGPVYYQGADLGQNGYDNRKRYDALNDFFGDAKRRQIDPTSYAEVGSRLTLLQGIPFQGGGLSDYIPTGPAMVSANGHGGSAGPIAQHQYALPPMPNLRTKNDLLNIDQFLEQVQSTVYESSNSAAAAGIQQPGAHYTHTLLIPTATAIPLLTTSKASAHMASQVSSSHSTAPMRATHSSQSNSSGTPALTPASSSVSYTSGHSPTSSQHGLSPTPGHSSTSAPYPSLPADANGYSPHSTAAPASTLGTNFENDFRRRYSGGMLQRSAYPDSSFRADEYPSTPTPTKERPEVVVHSSASNAYPSLTSISSPGSDNSESGDSATARAEEVDRREEEWVENIRVIEALRRLIGERLERKEYEDDGDVAMSGTAEHRQTQPAQTHGQSLYPVLRADD